MKINYKKCLYYGICLGFAIIGAISMENNLMYSFYWWTGFINLGVWGGMLMIKLLTYLKE